MKLKNHNSINRISFIVRQLIFKSKV